MPWWDVLQLVRWQTQDTPDLAARMLTHMDAALHRERYTPRPAYGQLLTGFKLQLLAGCPDPSARAVSMVSGLLLLCSFRLCTTVSLHAHIRDTHALSHHVQHAQFPLGARNLAGWFPHILSSLWGYALPDRPLCPCFRSQALGSARDRHPARAAAACKTCDVCCIATPL